MPKAKVTPETPAVMLESPVFAHVDEKKNFGSYWVKTGTTADGTKVTAAYDAKVIS